jgi:phage recombination protein Bet
MSSTALATQNTNLKTHAPEPGYFNEEQRQLLADHIMKGATKTEIQYFGEVCKRVGLDPFKKQIHAVQRWDNASGRMVWSYQTGIDGYVAIAHRNGLCAGIEDIKFLPADENTPNPTKATCTVWKIVGGQRVPFTASARWNEYVQTKKDGKPNSMWLKMPYGQLGKCAKALALRMAFPEELSAILTDVEMDQADSEGERPGEPPAGRPAHFSMESKAFEPEARIEAPKPEAQAEPEPAATPAKKQAAVVDAEIVETTADNTGIHPKVAKLLGGAWKKSMGVDKGKPLAEARQAAFDNAEADPGRLVLALASIVDEVRARLAAKQCSEKFLADHLAENGMTESPQHLWTSAELYPDILAAVKALK